MQIGGYEQQSTLCGRRGELPDDFSFGLYEIYYERAFFPIVNAAISRLPALETAGIMNDICGPVSMTPDHGPLVGESPDVKVCDFVEEIIPLSEHILFFLKNTYSFDC